MKLAEFETVRLLKSYPKEDLKVGDVGVVIMVYTNPNEAYEIEFVDTNGRTKAQLTLLPNEIEKYHESKKN